MQGFNLNADDVDLRGSSLVVDHNFRRVSDTVGLSWAAVVEKGDCPLKETENAMTQMVASYSHCY